MTIEECYREMEGSYAEVSGRLPSLKLIEKFISKFLEDIFCTYDIYFIILQI